MNASVIFKIGMGNKLRGLYYSWLPIESSQNTTRFSVEYRDGEENTLPTQIIYMVEPNKNLCAPYLIAKDSVKLGKFQKNNFSNNV